MTIIIRSSTGSSKSLSGESDRIIQKHLLTLIFRVAALLARSFITWRASLELACWRYRSGLTTPDYCSVRLWLLWLVLLHRIACGYLWENINLKINHILYQICFQRFRARRRFVENQSSLYCVTPTPVKRSSITVDLGLSAILTSWKMLLTIPWWLRTWQAAAFTSSSSPIHFTTSAMDCSIGQCPFECTSYSPSFQLWLSVIFVIWSILCRRRDWLTLWLSPPWELFSITSSRSRWIFQISRLLFIGLNGRFS